MGTAKPLYKADVEARLKERVARLELRDQERAREIMRSRAALVILEKRVAQERELRVAAEDNAKRFYALLLQERVSKIGAQRV